MPNNSVGHQTGSRSSDGLEYRGAGVGALCHDLPSYAQHPPIETVTFGWGVNEDGQLVWPDLFTDHFTRLLFDKDLLGRHRP